MIRRFSLLHAGVLSLGIAGMCFVHEAERRPGSAQSGTSTQEKEALRVRLDSKPMNSSRDLASVVPTEHREQVAGALDLLDQLSHQAQRTNDPVLAAAINMERDKIARAVAGLGSHKSTEDDL